MNKQAMKQDIEDSIRLLRVNLKEDKINQVNVDWLSCTVVCKLNEVLEQLNKLEQV